MDQDEGRERDAYFRWQVLMAHLGILGEHLARVRSHQTGEDWEALVEQMTEETAARLRERLGLPPDDDTTPDRSG